MELLEGMMFRQTVNMLRRKGELPKRLTKDLNRIYNKRNKYVHIQSSAILNNLGEEQVEFKNDKGKVVQTTKVKDYDLLKSAAVLANADDEAPPIIKLTEECLNGLFEINKSGYWKRLVWGLTEQNADVPQRNGKGEKSGVP
jgi:hypothetical protein